jgi:hypothetical protein
MIAVHSRGFTKPALNCALDKNILTVSARKIDLVNWKDAAGIPEFALTTAARSYLSGRLGCEDHALSSKTPKSVRFGKTVFTVEEVNAWCRSLVNDWIQNEVLSPGTTLTIPRDRTHTKTVRFKAVLPDDSYVHFDDGTMSKLMFLDGVGVAQVEIRRIAWSKPMEHADKVVLDGELKMFGRGVRTVLALNANTHRAHMQPFPGEGISFGPTRYPDEALPAPPPFALAIEACVPAPCCCALMPDPVARRSRNRAQD